jgi:hypothetical protein
VAISRTNNLPNISDISDQTTDENKQTGAISFTIGDIETLGAEMDFFSPIVE